MIHCSKSHPSLSDEFCNALYWRHTIYTIQVCNCEHLGRATSSIITRKTIEAYWTTRICTTSHGAQNKGAREAKSIYFSRDHMYVSQSVLANNAGRIKGNRKDKSRPTKVNHKNRKITRRIQFWECLHLKACAATIRYGTVRESVSASMQYHN